MKKQRESHNSRNYVIHRHLWYSGYFPLCLARKYLIFLPISELASIKDLDNSILLSKHMEILGILFKTNVSIKPKKIYYTIKKTISVTLSVYLCFDNVWRVNITHCVIQSWPSGGLRLVADRNKKKPRVEH